MNNESSPDDGANNQPLDNSPADAPGAAILMISLVVLVVFGITLALGSVEIYFRFFAKPPQTWTDRPKKFYLSDTSFDLKGNAAEDTRKAGEHLVSIVGDSFTFGVAMQARDAYPQRINDYLNLNSGVPKTRVLNLGVPGGSTQSEVAVVNKAIELGSESIILEITLNDPAVRPLSKESPEIKGDYGPYNPQSLLAKFLNHSMVFNFVASRLHNERSITSYINYHQHLFGSAETWEPFKASLTGIVERCRQNNIAVGFVIFPLFDFPLDEKYPFLNIHKKIVDTLSPLNVPVLDLKESFENIPVLRLQLIPGADTHPNEIAHRIASEKILTWGLKSELFPATSRPTNVYGTRYSEKGYARDRKAGQVADDDTTTSDDTAANTQEQLQ